MGKNGNGDIQRLLFDSLPENTQYQQLWMPGSDICFYCGQRLFAHGQRDHVTPRAIGGNNRWTNLVNACAGCNHRKANYSIKAFVQATFDEYRERFWEKTAVYRRVLENASKTIEHLKIVGDEKTATMIRSGNNLWCQRVFSRGEAAALRVILGQLAWLSRFWWDTWHGPWIWEKFSGRLAALQQIQLDQIDVNAIRVWVAEIVVNCWPDARRRVSVNWVPFSWKEKDRSAQSWSSIAYLPMSQDEIQSQLKYEASVYHDSPLSTTDEIRSWAIKESRARFGKITPAVNEHQCMFWRTEIDRRMSGVPRGGRMQTAQWVRECAEIARDMSREKNE